jgi:hypothetical protein
LSLNPHPVDDDVGGGEKSAGEIDPRNERSEIKNGIWKAGGWQLGEASEEECEGDHAEQRLENDSEDADGGPLVADFYVAPDEEVEEFAVAPELGEAELEGGAGRLDADDGWGRWKRKSGGRRGSSDRRHQVLARNSERKITPNKVTRELAEWARVAGRMASLGLGGGRVGVWQRLIALFDLAHEVATAEKVGAELRRDGARDDRELIAGHLREVDGAAGGNQMNAPLKEEAEIPENKAGEQSGRSEQGGAGCAQKLGEAFE